MIGLCLDTSSATSVAVVRDGRTVARARNDSARHHAESIAPMLRGALDEAGLTGALTQAGITQVLVGTGPAPYTGLRAGLVTARALARACGAPVHGASSLDILARQALDVLPPDAEVLIVSDARRKELYWALYRAQGPDDVAVVSGPRVDAPRQVANALRGTDALLVSGAPLPGHAREALSQAPTGPEVVLDPAVLVRLVAARLDRGETGRLGTEPLYLRRPDIQGQSPRPL
ncbi:MAG: tRNA (adenosine(37)-N6)-threonylcarbamoyltransferase complex dimerization subunit type 1 TsaB [Actinomyces sp.]|nr:tRNA (adenosine(37)-N6)-threonylcarbamoyltransferase complex dimerization subunit type 1 TsaB [Actinomyces sp.]MCI1641332.1 tRNA (adenosine(37)-N6)-threonylcarbamoyltransferase complex dimerization subunit type 1 TsaB [Actinomyces sp.]MCI1662248.1 tRNA (adenosine(37)-N6)-threonylcarbamoyltransferase complex dimerization subunit type 1 TsaB [Actinomyces sp.]MCI1691039.1 tRNA (adenosine(37)-N6)-threonylcarbamoyltransferase complex dimerization subunit type 1 TsaB [Actinomyces sp.]MCI1787525.1 